MIEALSEAAERRVSRETMDLLDRFVALLKDASGRQNLISAATLDAVWERHILDSAQLVRFEPKPEASWVDIGSGAGLPGIVIAALAEGHVTLVEPRRLRAQFLEEVVATLGLRATIVCQKVERVEGRFDVITARAVAALPRLVGMARHLSGPETLWVLPKGRNAKSELAEAGRSWQCEASSEASITDPESEILVLRKVGARR
jgi:16S rRNA (guanine527-N7)-methyltransferase